MRDHALAVLRAELAAHLRRRVSGAPTPACLDDLTVARLADGKLRGDDRLTALRHLAGCSHCRSVLAEVARALSDREVRGALSGRAPLWRQRRWQLALPVAAAAVLLLLMSRPNLREDVPAHRERGVIAAPPPAPSAPVGTVAAAPLLQWRAVQGADRYRVMLFGESRVLYEVEVTDTVAALPDSLRLQSSRTYQWKVDARTGFGRWVSSELVRFTIAPGERP